MHSKLILKLWLVFFSCLLFLSYAWLDNPFLFDDVDVIASNQWLDIKLAANYFRSFIPTSQLSFIVYRPLVILSFAIQKHIFGLDPFWFRLLNVWFHSINGVLVFVLLKQLKIDKTIAIISAFVFLIHPVNHNVLSLVWKRSDLFVTFGFLIFQISVVRWLSNHQIRDLILVYFGLFFSFFSKENALISMVLLVILSLYLGADHLKSKKNWLLLYFPVFFFSACFAYVIFVQWPKAIAAYGLGFHSYNVFDFDASSYRITQLWCLVKYLMALLVPNDLTVYHYITPIQSFFDQRLLMGLLALVLMFVTMVVCYKKNKVISLMLMLFLIHLLPTSMHVLNLVYDEDRLYLPSISFALVLVYFVFNVRHHRFREIRILFYSILVLYAFSFHHHFGHWKNAETLWGKNSEIYPNDPRPLINFANSLSQKHNRFEKIEKLYLKAIELEPSYSAAYYYYGCFAFEGKQYDLAKKLFLKTIDLQRFMSQSYNYLGVIEVTHHNGSLAHQYFESSFKHMHHNVQALRNWAKLHIQEGDENKAIEKLNLALLLAPWDQDTIHLMKLIKGD